MTEPKTLHLWLPEGRSLCDRRHLPESTSAPEEQAIKPLTCMPCLLVLLEMVVDARILHEHAGGRVWPENVADAYRLLEGTRWAPLAKEPLADEFPFEELLGVSGE